jgi:hypothetical protein
MINFLFVQWLYASQVRHKREALLIDLKLLVFGYFPVSNKTIFSFVEINIQISELILQPLNFLKIN